MTKESIEQWENKINLMDACELDVFEYRTLALSPVDKKSKDILMEAADKRRRQFNKVPVSVVSSEIYEGDLFDE